MARPRRDGVRLDEDDGEAVGAGRVLGVDLLLFVVREVFEVGEEAGAEEEAEAARVPAADGLADCGGWGLRGGGGGGGVWVGEGGEGWEGEGVGGGGEEEDEEGGWEDEGVEAPEGEMHGWVFAGGDGRGGKFGGRCKVWGAGSVISRF